MGSTFSLAPFGPSMAAASPLYSHSRLSTFEYCPFQYKLRYVDRVKMDDPGTIEQFLGSRVHEALEWLHDLALRGRVATEDELLAEYERLWEELWDDRLRIVKTDLDAEHYREVGRRCARDYHRRHHPFDSGRTLGLELRVKVELPDAHRLQGYIDRLEKTPEGRFVIHDYKTSGRLPEPTWAASDRQLALYALAIRERFEEAEADNIQLAWHYVAFDEIVTSTRTGEQLDQLAHDTSRLIETVELAVAERKLPTSTGTLCEWCEYRPLCPEFAHQCQLEAVGSGTGQEQTSLMAAEMTAEEASELVDRLVELQTARKEASATEAELKERLVEYSRQTGHTTIFGSLRKARVSSSSALYLPSAGSDERQDLEAFLKEAQIWDELTSLDAARVKRLAKAEAAVDHELSKTDQERLKGLLETRQNWQVRLSNR